MSNKKKLITSALPYVNNVPHLGNIIGCVLSADVYARFCRSMGYETLYICATDEYGTATENKAREEGLTPKQVCDKYHAIHRDIYQHFQISFDYFGRTSYPEQTEIAQEIFFDLDKNGYILEQETEQTYCEHDQMFLADRYVEGVCPHCSANGAKGDQCDSCGKLLHPTELIDARCIVCGKNPVVKQTRHLYLDLPALEPALREFQHKSIQKGKWSKNAIGTTKSWMEAGLNARPITRDLKWGIPVPKEGFENKVFYVWYDAPIGYISMTKRGFPDTWKNWWFDPENTELYQFMAKDNIPFHTVIFPACLLGSKKNWTLLHHLSSTEYLNYENEKFSKSNNVGVFGTDVIESEIPIDLWRFYLLFNRPEKSDANFHWGEFFEVVNQNFIDNIGNLVHRTLTFFHKNFDGKIEPVTFSEVQTAFRDQILSMMNETVQQYDRVHIKDAIKHILAIGSAANKFFQDQEPWRSIKTNAEETKSMLILLTCIIRDIALLLEPVMPETGKRILAMLGGAKGDFAALGKWEKLNGLSVPKPKILFSKLDAEQAENFRMKFGGKEKSVDVEEPFDNILLKVGQIKTAKRHPSADKLYIEEIDCGEEKLRMIVSGLVAYVTEEELIGKKVLVAANLAPAKLRGVMSEGMVLAVENKSQLEVIDLEKFSIGDVVDSLNKESRSPSEQISIDDFFAAPMRVQNNQLVYKNNVLTIGGQPVTTKEISEGSVK